MQPDPGRFTAHRAAGARRTRFLAVWFQASLGRSRIRSDAARRPGAQRAPSCRVFPLSAYPIGPHRRGRVVDRHRERGHVESRPRRVGVVHLSDDVVGAMARHLNRGQRRRSEHCRRGMQCRFGSGHARSPTQANRQAELMRMTVFLRPSLSAACVRRHTRSEVGQIGVGQVLILPCYCRCSIGIPSLSSRVSCRS